MANTVRSSVWYQGEVPGGAWAGWLKECTAASTENGNDVLMGLCCSSKDWHSVWRTKTREKLIWERWHALLPWLLTAAHQTTYAITAHTTIRNISNVWEVQNHRQCRHRLWTAEEARIWHRWWWGACVTCLRYIALLFCHWLKHQHHFWGKCSSIGLRGGKSTEKLYLSENVKCFTKSSTVKSKNIQPIICKTVATFKRSKVMIKAKENYCHFYTILWQRCIDV